MAKSQLLLDAIKANKTALQQKYGRYWSSKAKTSDFKLINNRYVMMDDEEYALAKEQMKPIQMNNAKLNEDKINIVKFDVNYWEHMDAPRPAKVIPVTVTNLDASELAQLKTIARTIGDEFFNMSNIVILRKIFTAKGRDKRIINIFSEELYGGFLDISNMRFYQYDDKFASLASFNAVASNCAINAITRCLTKDEIEEREEKLAILNRKYAKTGVNMDGFKLISKELNINLTVYHGTLDNASVKKFTRRDKNVPKVEIIVQSQHAMAKHMVDKKVVNYKFVEGDYELATILEDNLDRIYSFTEASITIYENDDTFTTYQLSSIYGVPLTEGKLSLADALLDELTNQIEAFPASSSNIQAYNSLTKHGVHYSTGLEAETDLDFDLCNAYSNFKKFPIYKGLPKNIKYWINVDASLVTVLSVIADLTGFAFCVFRSPLHGGDIKHQWLYIACVIELAKYDLIIEINQLALSTITFDLDTSKLIDDDPEIEYIENPITGEIETFKNYKIEKRVFHRLLGCLGKSTSYKSFITKDPLEGSSFGGYKVSSPAWYKGDSLSNIYENVSVSYDSKLDRTAHVAAAIQDYVYTQVTLEYMRLLSYAPNAKLKTSLVDGFRIGLTDLNGYTPSNLFVQKPIKSWATPAMNDWVNAGTTAVDATNANDFVDIYSCKAKIHPKFHNMISESYDERSLLSIYESNRLFAIYGYAGSGKSTLIKNLYKSTHCIVLSPTHKTVVDFVKDGVNAITHQSACYNPLLIRGKQLIIIDEVSMVPLSDLIKIAQHLSDEQEMLIIGDPAQLAPLTWSSSMINQKHKYLVDNFDVSSKLTQFEIKKALHKVSLDKETDHATKLNEIDSLLTVKQMLIREFTTTDISSTAIIKPGKILTKIYRSHDTKLIKICDLIRKGKITMDELINMCGVKYIVDQKTEGNHITKEELKGKRILCYKNADINDLAEDQSFDMYLVAKPFTVTHDGDKIKLFTNQNVSLVNDKLHIVSKNIFVDITPEIKKNLIQARITSFHKAQGETITEPYCIDISLQTKQSLYVAFSRAQRLDQITLVSNTLLPKFTSFEKFDISKVESHDIEHDMFNKYSVISLPKDVTLDMIELDKFLEDLPKLKDMIDTDKDIKAEKNKLRKHIFKTYLKRDDEKKEKDKPDFEIINDIKRIIQDCNGQVTFKLSQPKSAVVTSYDLNGSFEENVDFDYCMSIAHKDTRIFAWFHCTSDSKNFHENMSKSMPNCEVHDVFNNKINNFFMDIDFKTGHGMTTETLETINTWVINQLTTAFKSVVTEDVDLCFTQRSRNVDDINHMKISIHMYTNLACDMTHMKEIAQKIKEQIKDESLADSIDMQPYAINKSMSLPGFIKNDTKQTIVSGKFINIFDLTSSIILDKYIVSYSSHDETTNDVSLLDEALKHITKCELFDDDAMDVAYASKNAHCAHIRRVRGSYCCGCNGHHSNDNTLRVYLYKNAAFAKCSRGGKSYFLCGSSDEDAQNDELEELEDELRDAQTELELATQQLDTELIEEMEILISELKSKIAELKK